MIQFTINPETKEKMAIEDVLVSPNSISKFIAFIAFRHMAIRPQLSLRMRRGKHFCITLIAGNHPRFNDMDITPYGY